jgi:AraC-like DNA-binding protein
MSFVKEERASDSPFVRTIWHTRSESDGLYLAAADGCWDLLLIKQDEATNVFLAGPTSRATPIPYVEGSEYFAIRFQLGTFLPHIPASQMMDRTILLPRVGKTSFWLGDSAWQLPTYDNVETFVAQLVRRELLLCDNVVEDTLSQEQAPTVSSRSVQRHFLRTTGLTQHCIRQIERASLAAHLLRQGVPLLTVVHKLGYFDQSHMTNALKRFIGYTPAQIVRTAKP